MSRDSEGRWGKSRTLVKGGAAGVWSPDGSKVATEMRIGEGKFAVSVVAAGGGTPRVVGKPQDRAEAGIGWAFSRDGKYVYYISNKSTTEKSGIWRVPANGGLSQPVAWYDGVPGGFSRSVLRVRGDRMYLSIGDPESDVWVTELALQR